MSSPTSHEEIRWLVNELYTAWSLHEPHRIDAIFTDDAIYSDIAGGKNQHEKQNSFRLRGASILAFRDARISKVTDYYDMATFLRQLGVL